METGRDVLLCIVPDTFVTSFPPYAQWKRKTGFTTVITKFSEIGANATNPDLIKNYIAQTYMTWEHPPPTCSWWGTTARSRASRSWTITFANEDFFVELEGNDYFPEMMIGRFTHETDYRLRVMVNKSIRYEKTPYTDEPDMVPEGHGVLQQQLRVPDRHQTVRGGDDA